MNFSIPRKSPAASAHRRVLSAALLLLLLPSASCAVQKPDESQNGAASAQAACSFQSSSAAPVESAFSSVLSDDASVSPSKLIEAPFIDQRGSYPTGCESVTSVMALQYWNQDIDVDTFIDDYLPQGNAPQKDGNGNYTGPNPAEVFVGNPRSDNGWGCYAPVIIHALKSALSGTGYPVKDLSGTALDELCRQYLDRDIPVILWATIDMAAPFPGIAWTITGTNRTLQWIRPMHCLLLVGYDDNGYYFNDPMRGAARYYTKADVKTAYDGQGQQAVAVLPRA